MRIERCDESADSDECAREDEIDDFINNLIVLTYTIKNNTLSNNI